MYQRLESKEMSDESFFLKQLKEYLGAAATDPLPFFNIQGQLVCTIKGKQIVGIRTIIQYAEKKIPPGFPDVIKKPLMDLNRNKFSDKLNYLVQRLQSHSQADILGTFKQQFIDLLDLDNKLLAEILLHPTLKKVAKFYFFYQAMGCEEIPFEFQLANSLKHLEDLSEKAALRATRCKAHKNSYDFIQAKRGEFFFARLVSFSQTPSELEPFLETCRKMIPTMTNETLHCRTHDYGTKKISIADLFHLQKHKDARLFDYDKQINYPGRFPAEAKGTTFPVDLLAVEKEAQRKYQEHVEYLLKRCFCELTSENSSQIVRLIPLIPAAQLQQLVDLNRVIDIESLPILTALKKHNFVWNASADNAVIRVCERKDVTPIRKDMIKFFVNQGVELPFDSKIESKDLISYARACYETQMTMIMRICHESTPINTKLFLVLVLSYLNREFVPDPNKVFSNAQVLFRPVHQIQLHESKPTISENDTSLVIKNRMTIVTSRLAETPEKSPHYFELSILQCLLDCMYMHVTNPDKKYSDLESALKEKKSNLLSMSNDKITHKSLDKVEKSPIFKNLLSISKLFLQKRESIPKWKRC